LVIVYWLLVIGYWLLVIGYWLLVIGYCLLIIMGNPKAFLEIHRQEAGYRPIHDRIHDFGEVRTFLPLGLSVGQQGSRVE